jgi:hypothetical protein
VITHRAVLRAISARWSWRCRAGARRCDGLCDFAALRGLHRAAPAPPTGKRNGAGFGFEFGACLLDVLAVLGHGLAPPAYHTLNCSGRFVPRAPVSRQAHLLSGFVWSVVTLGDRAALLRVDISRHVLI